MKFDLGGGHLGNGLLIWNRAKEEHGDYQKIAHIGPDRKITWYIKNPPKDVIKYVEEAAKSDPNVSHTQDQKVFHTKAGAMNLKNLKIGETVISSSHDVMDKAYAEREEKAKKALPHIWRGVEELFHGPIMINSIQEITSPSGKHKIYFVEEPGHGHYLNSLGKYIGEEDEGLDSGTPESKELIKELANYSLVGKACSTKDIV